MKKLGLSFAAISLAAVFSNANVSATNLKIIFENDTEQNIHFKKPVTQYSYFSGQSGLDLLELEKKDKEEFNISISSRDYFEKVSNEEITGYDKIFFEIGEGEDSQNKGFIFWHIKPYSQFEPELSLGEGFKYKATLEKKPYLPIYSIKLIEKE